MRTPGGGTEVPSGSARDVLKGLTKKDIRDLQSAIKRKDASYIRGMIQWYNRHPVKGNEHLSPFLRRCLSLCSSSTSSSRPSEE